MVGHQKALLLAPGSRVLKPAGCEKCPFLYLLGISTQNQLERWDRTRPARCCSGQEPWLCRAGRPGGVSPPPAQVKPPAFCRRRGTRAGAGPTRHRGGRWLGDRCCWRAAMPWPSWSPEGPEDADRSLREGLPHPQRVLASPGQLLGEVSLSPRQRVTLPPCGRVPQLRVPAAALPASNGTRRFLPLSHFRGAEASSHSPLPLNPHSLLS